MKIILSAMIASASLATASNAADGKPLGYSDTPLIPGTKWHVHDGNRPQPKVVTPGEPSTQEKVGTAPSDAVVLFDGKDLSKWKKSDGQPAPWKVENGYIEVAPKTGDIFTKDEFGPNVQIHIEFATPPPVGDGQGRGNSGLFLYGRYEIQVLDSYNNPTYPDGQATALYGYMPPQVNASRKPGEWQTYDVIFEGPKFKDGKLEKPAHATILHNGVLTQNHVALIGSSGHRTVGTYKAHGEKGALKLQDHGNPMRFRNMWIREFQNPTAEDIGDGPLIGK
ncbi:MAG TPA: DUF1080 domain-containing protein [Chthoniobacteraceae bacterium]|jgi:hypothetical protein|nr:hypothetical protein [Chthoniobacter sp.]HEV7867742.1 DUF1080 domain-containing protein [Chthoniobacteraceae bacterium]